MHQQEPLTAHGVVVQLPCRADTADWAKRALQAALVGGVSADEGRAAVSGAIAAPEMVGAAQLAVAARVPAVAQQDVCKGADQ